MFELAAAIDRELVWDETASMAPAAAAVVVMIVVVLIVGLIGFAAA